MKIKNLTFIFIYLSFIIAFTLVNQGIGENIHIQKENALEMHIYAFLNTTKNNTSQSNVTVISTTNQTLYYVEIDSMFPGQPQMLTIPVNGSGFFMYPYWTFRFFSDAGIGNITTYSIYMNGLLLKSGTFSFTTSYSVNVSFNMVNVSVVLQSNKGITIWNYHMIPILHSTLANYYKGFYVEKPAYTVTQYLEFGGEIVATAILLTLGAYYVMVQLVIKKRNEEPERLL